MYAPPLSPPSLRITHFFTHWLAGLFVAVLLAMAGMPAHAAAPAAGASIENAAAATYTDGSGVSRTVTSNKVVTTVTQVGSMTLVANGSQTATPGSVIYYPHTLTNTGNGTDTFALTSSNSGAFSMTGVTFYADNGSGLPTGAAITSTGPLAAGIPFKFIVQATVPNTATAAQTNAIVVTGTGASIGGVAATASNTDTTTVTTNAVVTLTKAISAANGLPGSGPYTYTLTYTNTGNTTATAFAVTDVLPLGMTYVTGSARWSTTGATALNDSVAGGSTGTAPNTIVSSYAPLTRTLLATVSQIAAGESKVISFQVNVAASTAPGVLNNTATTSYNNGAGTTVTGTSNTVPFTVKQVASVTQTGATVAGPAAPGSTVSFTNVVTNTGTGIDTFNMVVNSSNFPAGTTFLLYKSDGATPLVDTGTDGIIDTGPIAAGASYNVILKATLPPNATNVGAPFIVTKTATSVFDPTKSATAADQLTAITSPSVDLTNNLPVSTATASLGLGNPNITLAVTNPVNPGATTTFTLIANNTGPSPDSYNLAASTAAGFGTLTLPAGWTVTFKADGGAGNCSTTGATITNTGNVPSAGNVTVCAVVSVPAGFAAGTSDLYFRTASPTSAVSDILHDAVKVNELRSITLTPNGAGQTYPGGTYVYSHTLTNTGNVTEGSGTLSSVVNLATGNNQSGWTSTLYLGNLATGAVITGNFDLVQAGGLAPGASVTIINKVQADPGAVAGSVNVTTITVTTANGATTTYSSTAPVLTTAKDNTTVIVGNVTLVKEQALDAACANPALPAFVQTPLSAKPGDCVQYRITATNVGSADATLIVVSDSTPVATTMKNVAVVTAPGTVTGPAVGSTGAISATVGTLVPNGVSVLKFGVKIDQ